MEEIAEGLFRGVISILRWIVFELIIHIVLFNLGRVALLLATLGRYPRGKLTEKDEGIIALLGIFVIVAVWCAIALYNNYG